MKAILTARIGGQEAEAILMCKAYFTQHEGPEGLPQKMKQRNNSKLSVIFIKMSLFL